MAEFRDIEFIDTFFSPHISFVDGFLLGFRRDTHVLSPPFVDLFHSLHFTPDLHHISRSVSLHRNFSEEYYLRSLSDRISALELNFLRNCISDDDERKYTWTAEIGKGRNRKYELAAEIKPSRGLKFKTGEEKRYKWSKDVRERGINKKTVVELDDVGGTVRSYKWKQEVKDVGEKDVAEAKCRLKNSNSVVKLVQGKENESAEKKKKVVKKEDCETDRHLVKIEEVSDRGALFLRQAFAKRSTPDLKHKGKRKDLSSLDAAIMIQVSFRAYLIRRSQVLRALRELAVAKTKLKEIRTLFRNFTYRSCLAGDSEELQRFSEKAIVLLLTIDAIEGVDKLVRSAKRSMVVELEAVLDVVDPHPLGRSAACTRRRMFDMPTTSECSDRREIGAGVAKLVEIIEEEEEEAKCRLPD